MKTIRYERNKLKTCSSLFDGINKTLMVLLCPLVSKMFTGIGISLITSKH